MSDVVVLCYHAVSPDWPAQMSVTPERFEQQLQLLVGRGYRGATFAQAATAPPHRKTLAVTFDDGLRSVLERAFPLLERLGLPATVFVPTDLVGVERAAELAAASSAGLSGPYEDELRPLDWDELRQPSGRGLGDRLAHPHARAADDARRRGARRRARRVEGAARGRARAPCRTLAYPFGEADERVIAAAGAAGYDAACGLPTSFRRATALAWPRTGVWHSDGPASFRLKVARPVRLLQASAAFRALDRPRRAAKRVLRPGRIVRDWVGTSTPRNARQLGRDPVDVELRLDPATAGSAGFAEAPDRAAVERARSAAGIAGRDEQAARPR